MSQVKVTVSGSTFVFNRDILNSQLQQKLPQLVNDAVKNGAPLEFTFDRPSGTFTYILGYYQSGELHMPTCVCPGFFERELQYWGIEPEELSECCYYRYVRFQNDLETQRKFKKETKEMGKSALPMVTVPTSHDLTSFRHKIWRVVDSNTTTLAAKIYFGVVISMVLLSVFTMALSTEPSMRRPLNKCELLEYMEYTNHPNLLFIRTFIGNPSCTGNARTSGTSEVPTEEYDWEALWYYYYYYDESGGDYDSDDSGDNSTTTTTTEGTTTTTTDGSGHINTTFIREIMRRHNIKVPKLTVPKYTFDILEWIAMAFFTVDLFIRLFSCPSLKNYFLSFLNVIDACALVSSYIYTIVLSIRKEYRYEDSWIRTLEFLQIFRVLRLFRVVQNVRATQVLVYSMWQNLRDITLLGFLLFMAVSLFSTVLYFTEDEATVESIPQAWYWAVITLTTVGYGDISPKSYPGRFVAAVCAVCGIILLAVTLPIFVNNFLALYEFSCVQEANESRKSRIGYVREVSMDEPSTPLSRDTVKTNLFFVSQKSRDTDLTTVTKD